MAKVNKVTTEDSTTTVATEESTKGRVDFPTKDAMYKDSEGNIVSAVNEAGLLIAVPVPVKDAEGKVVYAGYNNRKHNPLKKTDFASVATFMRFQAHTCRLKAAVLIKAAEEKEKKAERIEKFGDEKTRKAVQRIAKMRENLAALEAQLKGDGIDIENI